MFGVLVDRLAQFMTRVFHDLELFYTPFRALLPASFLHELALDPFRSYIILLAKDSSFECAMGPAKNAFARCKKNMRKHSTFTW